MKKTPDYSTPAEMGKNKKKFQAVLQSRDHSEFKEFKSSRNKLKKAIRKSKEEYYRRIFHNNCLQNSDVTWKKLNTIFSRKRMSNCIDHFAIDNAILREEELANRFKDFLYI